MKSTVEQLSPTRVRINVEIPFGELKADFDRAYKTLASQVRLPGFRPGKAPAKLLEARVGRAAVLEQVVRDAVPSRYTEALTAADVRPLGPPEIEVTKIEDGEELHFSAETDIRPTITLPDFSAISVEVEPLEVTDEAVDEQLTALQARFGTLTGVERAVQNGDFVSLDLSATVDGEKVEEAAATGLSHEVGSGQLIDGLDEAIIGVSAGESTEFTTTLVAGDFAGREAAVTATVNTVKERELPAADDDFAQLASEFDTIDELKADLRERVENSRRAGQAEQIRDKILAAILEATEVPLPEAVVKAEVDNQIHNVVHALDHDEDKLAELLASQGTTREEFEAQAKDSAEKSIKTQLLLDTIAEESKIEVSQEELTERILFQARQYNMAPDEFISRMQQADQLGALFADVRRAKGFATIVPQVTVKDTNGATVDTAELLGPAPTEAQAEAEGDQDSAEGEAQN